MAEFVLQQTETILELHEDGGVLEFIDNGQALILEFTEEISNDVTFENEQTTIEVIEDPEVEFITLLEKGDKGDRGSSAYEIAVKNGYNGTEQQWNNFLRPDFLNDLGDFNTDYKAIFEGRLVQP